MKARAVSYGAVELKQMEHRYMAVGLFISVAIHICVITAYILRGLVTFSGLPLPTPQPLRPHPDWTQVNILTPVLPAGIPDTHRGGGKHSGGKYAVPVPVPIPPSNEDTLLFKQGNPGTDIGPDEGGTDLNAGVGPGTIINEEKPPEPFVPVEREPVVVKKVNPPYPELALKAGLEGQVWVNIWVDQEGKAHKVVLLKSTAEIFNDAALAAAKQFTFVPAYMNGGPVAVWVSIPFAFRLR